MSSKSKKILFLSYSFSGQTANLLRSLQAALEKKGHQVTREKLATQQRLRFPASGYQACIKMMLITFFRKRYPINNLSPVCKEKYDLIILAGPTWSYNPSGPILSLLDSYGPSLFKGQTVLPVISCRGYWRMHWFGLKRLLKKCGAKTPNLMVFSHPSKEPWRTIGVFMKISGKTPEKSLYLKKFYKKFGHSRKQQQEAERFGLLIGEALANNTPLADINFRTPKAMP